MNNTNKAISKKEETTLKDFGRESYWADFKAEVGIAASYGFPKDIEKAALAENFRAQNNLAVLYYLRKNQPGNYEKAAYWFRKAAEKGFAVSQYNLGIMYQQGKGVNQDDKKSFDWLLKAAETGYAIAQYQLSQYYAIGKGTKQSIRDEYKWLKQAVESGNPLAQFELGKFSTEEILLKEIFGDSDNSKGQIQRKINWLVTAAVQGYAPAQIKLGNYYQHGYKFKQDPKKALHWYFKAAEQGHSRGQFYLGSFLYNGIGVERNISEAVKWFSISAEQGDSDAQFNLGLFYHKKEKIKDKNINLGEAAKWYLKAAEQGNVDALYQLITLSKHDSEVCQNFKESVPCFRKAAEQGNADAQYQLGLIYERGFGGELHYNYLEAETWIRKSAEQGNVDAQYHLGQAYEQGVQEKEVIKWYYEAADHGHEKACFILGKAYLHESCNSIKVPQDYNKAFEYLTKASINRKSYIIGELAICYLCGLGVDRNLSFAIDIFQSLALRKYEIPPISIVAKIALAKMYLAGEGVNKKEENVLFYLYSIKDFLPYFKGSQVYKFDGCLKLNDKDLFQWLAQKASGGDVRSQSILGLYYFCHQNYVKSIKWYQLAANQGDLRAKASLPEIYRKASAVERKDLHSED
jgi:TPR repeat protein